MAASSSDQEPFQSSPFKELGFPDDFVTILSQKLRTYLHENGEKNISRIIAAFNAGSLMPVEVLNFFKITKPSIDLSMIHLKTEYYKVFGNAPPNQSRFSGILPNLKDLNILDESNQHKIDHDYFNEKELEEYEANISNILNHLILQYAFFFMFLNPSYRDHLMPRDQRPDMPDFSHELSIIQENTLRIFSDPKNKDQEVGTVDLDSLLYSPRELFFGKKLYFTWEPHFFGRTIAKLGDRIFIILVKPPSKKVPRYRLWKISTDYSLFNSGGRENFRLDQDDFVEDLKNPRVLESEAFINRMMQFHTRNNQLFTPTVVPDVNTMEWVREKLDMEWFQARKLSLFYLLSHLVEQWRQFRDDVQRSLNTHQPAKLTAKSSISRDQTTNSIEIFGMVENPKMFRTDLLSAEKFRKTLSTIFRTSILIDKGRPNQRAINFHTFFLIQYSSEQTILAAVDDDFDTKATTHERREFFNRTVNDLANLTSAEIREFRPKFIHFVSDQYNNTLEKVRKIKGMNNIRKYIETNSQFESYEERLDYFDISLPLSDGVMIKRVYMCIIYLMDVLDRYLEQITSEDDYLRFKFSSLYKDGFPKKKAKRPKSACPKCH